MRIIDTHHHLWDLTEHYYPWLTDKIEPKPYGDYSSLRRNYLIEDFFRDIGPLPVTRSVHVNAGIHLPDSVLETAWLQEIADDAPRSRGFPHAIVFDADFLDSKLEQDFARHCQHRNVRGVRQILSGAITANHRDVSALDAWHASVKLLRKFDLSFDLQIHPVQMPRIYDCARQNSETTFVICHAGFVNYRDPDMVATWRRGIRMLAELPNVMMKISGFMIFDLNWTAESVAPVVHELIDVFGIKRCFFGSNFPPDELACSYGSMWSKLIETISHFSESERDHLLYANAASTYRID